MSRLAPRPHDDAGSALVIALLFITSFSLLLGSVITFAEVGLKASKTLSAQADSAYATDGAVNAAINRFRDGGPCDNYRSPSWPAAQSAEDPPPPPRMFVRCEGGDRPATVQATRPANALLSLGPEGISTYPGFEQGVDGDIFSRSDVAAGAKLVVQGQVSAVGNCNAPPGNVQTSPVTPLRCADNPDANFRADPIKGRDPDYTKAISAVPVRQTVPTCPATKWLVTLKPGYYDNADGLNALTGGSCPGRVVWLQPGNYYLDLDFLGGDGTWNVKDPSVVVVAGRESGWTPDPAGNLPAPRLTVPGSCQTNVAEGVQIVAGGGTKFDITEGQVEVCAAKPSTPDQSIALYGIGPRDVADPRPGVDRPKRTLEPTDAPSVSGFTGPGNATVIGETPAASAVATLTESVRTASLTLNAFRPGIPEGSVIESAFLRVRHEDVGDLAPGSIQVLATFPDSTCAAVAAPIQPTLAEDPPIDLKACGLTNPAAFADLAVTYSATMTAGGTAATDTLDGIAVEVTYLAPITGKPTKVTASSVFTDPDNALEIGEQPAALTADATLTSVGPTTASITVAGLGNPPTQPGSILKSAVLRVADRIEGEASATVTVGTCTTGLPLDATGIADDRKNILGCGLDAANLAGLTAKYDVVLTAGATATARLDGIWLELIYELPPPLTLPPAAVTPGPAITTFSSPENAKVIAESPTPLTADATLDSATPQATLTFTGFGLPAGSVIDSAVLRVAHKDDPAMDTPTLAVSFPGMKACLTPLIRRATLAEDRSNDLSRKVCGLTDSAQLAALAVTYTAKRTGTADAIASVDGVVLDVTYRPPATRRSTTSPPTTTGFINPEDAKIIGETPTPLTADATLAVGPTQATLTVDGFDGPVPLPAGSAIDSAVLRVAHQEDPWMGATTLAVAFPGNTCTDPQLVPPAFGAIGVFRSNLTSSCGLKSADQLAGLAATYTANAPPATITSRHSASAAAISGPGFVDPDRSRLIDGVTTDAALASAGPTSASLTLSAYDQAPPPTGAIINAAELRVAHREDVGVGQITATVSRSGTPCMTQPLTPSTTLLEEKFPIDRAACGLDTPTSLTDLTVTYSAALDGQAPPATASLDGAEIYLTYAPPAGKNALDGIELDIVYRDPTFRPLGMTVAQKFEGCVTAEPYPNNAYPNAPSPGGACALVRVAPPIGNITTRFSAQGTIYAPSAPLDISMAGLREQVLTRGLVARTIRLGLRADPAFKRPLPVPPEPVKFTAYPDLTAVTSLGSATGFTDPTNALVIGEKPDATSNASLDATKRSASITLGFNLPPGSFDANADADVIDAAVLRIAHSATGDIQKVTVTVGGMSCDPLPELSRFSASEDQINLTDACSLTKPSQVKMLTITYEAKLTDDGTAGEVILDGVTLDLLSGPLLRASVSFDRAQFPTVKGWSVLR